jgi:hypothetical protein
MLAERFYTRTGITWTRAACCGMFILLVLFIIVKSPGSTTTSVTTSTTTKGNNKGTTGEYEIPSTLNEHKNEEQIKSGRAKEEADELLQGLLTRIGDGQGPIIVGGIGDSGTRGAREVLIHLGAQMLGVPYVLSGSKDSEIYMSSYPTVDSKGERVLRAPAGLYNAPISRAHSLNYNESSMSFDHYHMGRQYVAKMVSRSMSISQQFRGQGKPIDPWGFKHPRTCLLMPFWYGSLKDKFVFVHVLRDGKDIVEGDNEKLFHDHCKPYYGKTCSNGLSTKLDFWADLNRDVFEYALNSNMGPHQYVAIRVEDLVMGNSACYKRLAAFIGIQPQDMETRVEKSIEANKGHMSSYLGNKWTDDVKATVENRVEHNSRAKNQFDFWGYHGDSYSFTKECEELEWMKLMRAKKGPLPGDVDYVL